MKWPFELQVREIGEPRTIKLVGISDSEHRRKFYRVPKSPRRPKATTPEEKVAVYERRKVRERERYWANKRALAVQIP